MLFALCGSVDAQQTEKVFRIGFLITALLPVVRFSWSPSGRSCASLAGSREKISPSSTGLPSKSHERLPELAADLVRLKVDFIVGTSPAAALAAKRATTAIPIVMRSLRILWVSVWSPVWRGREAMLPDSRV